MERVAVIEYAFQKSYPFEVVSEITEKTTGLQRNVFVC